MRRAPHPSGGAGAAIDRRAFVVGAVGFAAALGAALGARRLDAQRVRRDATPMDPGAYRPVRRSAKPGAAPSLTDDARDALERRIRCQCGCSLDVHTCRTTDFTCRVSPAMHRDVVRLVAGGYTAPEILDAFVATYGEVALTAPIRRGFNWVGYLAPGIVIATGGALIAMLLRTWSQEARSVAAAGAAAAPPDGVPGVTEDDLARLDRALREEA